MDTHISYGKKTFVEEKQYTKYKECYSKTC